MFETSLREIFITIEQYQKKLEKYRQLLSEEIQFNVKDLYIRVSGHSAQVTALHLQLFAAQAGGRDEADSTGEGVPVPGKSKERGKASEKEQGHVLDLKLFESMIKGYNNCSSMNLTFIEFALIFLSRENRLLSKLALERNSLGEMPQYLVDYARRILELEADLHSQLIEFRLNNSSAAEEWIKHNSVDGQHFDEPIIGALCREVDISQEVVMRYLKISLKEQLSMDRVLSLFTLKNCHKLSQYFKKVVNKKKPNMKDIPDPFVRPEFHDCLERPKILENFSFRELKSIEKHLERLNSRSKNQLEGKIHDYKIHVEKQLKLACLAINEIIWLEREIQYQRIQLCLCTDFYPVLFFDTFNKDRQGFLIPSSLQSYLERLGISIELNSLYTIFKRYSSRSDGKLNFNEFCSIFDVANPQYTHIEKNREVRTLEDVEVETIKHFLRLVRLIAKNEIKIEKIKANLQNEANLREVFSVFDSDEDGYVSMLDFKVIWKRFLFMDLKDEQIGLFWHRMRLSKDPSTMIRYQKFIYEMVPKAPLIEKQSRAKPKGKSLKTTAK